MWVGAHHALRLLEPNDRGALGQEGWCGGVRCRIKANARVRSRRGRLCAVTFNSLVITMPDEGNQSEIWPIDRAGCSLKKLVSNLVSGRLATPPNLDIRTVAVQSTQGRWHNYSTVIRVTDENRPTRKIVFPRLLLYRTIVQLSSVSEDAFDRVVTGWRLEVGAEHGFSLEDAVRPEREPSWNEWCDQPCLVISLEEQTPHRDSAYGPDGPFLNPVEGVFARDVPAVAQNWLDHPWRRDHQSRSEYKLIIPDTRVVLKDIARTPTGFRLIVSNKLDCELYCGVTCEDNRGVSRSIVRRLPKSGRQSIAHSYEIEKLDLWIMTSDGVWLDRYYENAQNAAWGNPILRDPHSYSDDYKTLTGALAIGESETVEFKPYVRVLNANDKIQEIVRTVCAFANTSGGAIYFGVSNELEILGTAGLSKEYQELCEGDRSKMESSYVRDLRRVITEAIAPRPELEFEWLEVAALRVLRLHVKSGQRKPFAVALSGDILVRTGGNNRKIRPSDIPHVFPHTLTTTSRGNLF